MYGNIGHERPHYDRVVAAAYFKTTQNLIFFYKNRFRVIKQN